MDTFEQLLQELASLETKLSKYGLAVIGVLAGLVALLVILGGTWLAVIATVVVFDTLSRWQSLRAATRQAQLCAIMGYSAEKVRQVLIGWIGTKMAAIVEFESGEVYRVKLSGAAATREVVALRLIASATQCHMVESWFPSSGRPRLRASIARGTRFIHVTLQMTLRDEFGPLDLLERYVRGRQAFGRLFQKVRQAIQAAVLEVDETLEGRELQLDEPYRFRVLQVRVEEAKPL